MYCPMESRGKSHEKSIVHLNDYLLYPEHGGDNAGFGMTVGTNGVVVSEHGANQLALLLVWKGNVNAGTKLAVVVTNKNNCASAQSSNTVTVMDCITKVVIQGPCTCSAGTSITLTANASSMLDPPGPPSSPTCGGPYTYLWSTGATTQSITMPCPSQTTTLWVEVTNAMGCKTKVFHTIKKCI